MAGDYQDQAYRRVWEEFRPDEHEEESRRAEEEQGEEGAEDVDEQGRRSRAVMMPKAPSAKGPGRAHGESLAVSKIGVSTVSEGRPTQKGTGRRIGNRKCR